MYLILQAKTSTPSPHHFRSTSLLWVLQLFEVWLFSWFWTSIVNCNLGMFSKSFENHVSYSSGKNKHPTPHHFRATSLLWVLQLFEVWLFTLKNVKSQNYQKKVHNKISRHLVLTTNWQHFTENELLEVYPNASTSYLLVVKWKWSEVKWSEVSEVNWSQKLLWFCSNSSML